MSRSGYIDDMDDQWALIRYRGAVKSAKGGKRGQALFADIVKALDALPEKKLIADSLQAPSGEFCTLGAVGAMRGINIEKLDPEDAESVAQIFGISESLAREVVYINDEWSFRETPEQRFERMHKWAASHIKKEVAA